MPIGNGLRALAMPSQVQEEIRSMPGLPPTSDAGADNPSNRLPVRWAMIFAVSIGLGFVVAHFEGPAAGVTAAITVATFLHAAVA